MKATVTCYADLGAVTEPRGTALKLHGGAG